MTEDLPTQHTPPLGHSVLTPLYDIAISLLTRERYWRPAFATTINPSKGDMIIDIGSGTGSLAIALWHLEPFHNYLGIDPDAEATSRARRKVQKIGAAAEFVEGYFDPSHYQGRAVPDKTVSSLVLHQVPLKEKSRIIAGMFDILKPGGKCLIADYGKQTSWIFKLLFRVSVQALDGVENTQPNVDGVLPELMQEAGFVDVHEVLRVRTLTGVISNYQGSKPLPEKSLSVT